MTRRFLEGELKFPFLDVIIIISLIGLGYYFFGLSAPSLEFSGSEIYPAIAKYIQLNALGYDVGVTVEGRDTKTRSMVNVEGRIKSLYKGSFVLSATDKDYRIGGKMASIEDVAASYIRFRILTPNVVYTQIQPVDFDSFDALCQDLRDKARRIVARDPASTKFEGQIAADTSYIGPASKMKLLNALSLTQDLEIFIYNEGIEIKGGSVSVDEICRIQPVLDSNLVKVQEGMTNKMTLKVGIPLMLSQDDLQRLKENLPVYAIKTSFQVMRH